MTRSASPESVLSSPLDADWTIAQLLDWIGADDARCHDDGLRGILDAVHQALQPDSPVVAAGVVMLVRSLATRVWAEPGLGERTLGEVVGVREADESAPAGVDVLVPV